MAAITPETISKIQSPLFTLLGTGSYGVVVKAKFPRCGALKIAQISQSNVDNMDEGEIGMLLEHQNILQYFGHWKVGGQDLHPRLLQLYDTHSKTKSHHRPSIFYIIHTEFCNGGTLQDWLIGSLNTSPPAHHYRSRNNTERFFAQILEGVIFLFEKGIVHGDLKPQNIFLHHKKCETVLKIGDFGGAFIHGTNKTKEVHWTRGYMLMLSYDMYSVGCIYSIMFMSRIMELDQDLITRRDQREHALHELLINVKTLGFCKTLRLHKTSSRGNLAERMLSAKESNRPNPHTVKATLKKVMEDKQIESFKVPGRNPLFSGRNDVLTKIPQFWSPPPMRLLFHGMPGTGKKSIIVEYLHSMEITDKSHVFWFNADSKSILETNYSNFMDTRKSGHSNAKQWLEAKSNWIAIYENVSCYTNIQHILPENGVVICTSRSETSFPPEFSRIKVGLLPMSDCAELIQNSVILSGCCRRKELQDDFLDAESGTTNVPSKEDCIRLAQEMGFLPTAIGQALAFMCRDSKIITTIPDFLEFHRRNMEQFDADGKIMKFSKKNLSPIYAVLLSIINRIKDENLIAFRLIKAISYFHSDNIPSAYIDAFLHGHNKNEVLQILNSYAILQQNEIADSFSVSRAIQETVKIAFYTYFQETLDDISTIFKTCLPTQNNGKVKGFGIVLRQRELVAHLESVIVHIDSHVSYVQDQTSTENTNLRNILLLQLKSLKCLQRAYATLQNQEGVKTTTQQMEFLEGSLFREDSRFLGNILMANGKTLLQSAWRIRHTPEFEKGVLEAIAKLKDAVPLLEARCTLNNKRTEIADCLTYLGNCYASFVRRQHFEPKWQNYSKDGRDLAENRIHNAQRYYFKALKKMETVVENNVKAFHKVSAIFHRMATNISKYPTSLQSELCPTLIAGEQRMCNNEETFLALSIHFDFVQTQTNHNYLDSAKPLEIFKNWENFKITPDFVEYLITSWKSAPQTTGAIFKKLLNFYERHQPDYSLQHQLTQDALNNVKIKHEVIFGKLYSPSEKLTINSGTTVISNALKELRLVDGRPLIIADTHVLLAKSLKKDGRLRESLANLQTALPIYIEHYTENDIRIAILYERVAECYFLLKEKSEACQFYKRAYNLWKTCNFLESNKKLMFIDLVQKYVTSIPDNEIDLKIQLLEECLTFVGKVKNDGVAFGYIKHKIGSLYLTKGDYSNAQKSLQEAMNIFNQCKISKGDVSRVSCLRKLAKAVEGLGCANLLAESYSRKLKFETESVAQTADPNAQQEDQEEVRKKRRGWGHRKKYRKQKLLWKKQFDNDGV